MTDDPGAGRRGRRRAGEERAASSAPAGAEASRWWPIAAAVVIVGVTAWLHWFAGSTFPRPWPDESHFLTPAITLVRDGRLAVPELNAPEGIFWMPTGYYLAQIPLLLLRVDPLVGGRLLSLAGMLVFAAGVAAAFRRTAVPQVVVVAAVAAWLWMPRIVVLSNIARMEGLVLGLAGATVWLTARQRWPLAVSVALLAPLVHPVGFVVAVAVGSAAAVRSPQGQWSRTERLLLAGVATAWLVEAAYFLAHADAAAEHLRFQLERKAGRPIVWRWWQVASLVLAGVGGLAATVRWWRRGGSEVAVWIAFALAGGFVVVDVVGREMWYEAIGRETVLLLGGLAAVAALTRWVPREVTRTAGIAGGVVLVIIGAAAVRQSTVGGWYQMRPDPETRVEWQAFTRAALAELQRMDAAGDEPATVVIDPLSGFGQAVTTRTFNRLRFVQPTPATPMDATAADYVLATPGAPFVTEALVQQWGVLTPALEVASSRQTFMLHLYANPATTPGG